ncbi:hypothetical protein [Bradyrhizobium sp. CCBAU 51753]|uniref:hypothetical protein n=1 Tax=Bradyrhizobium sp. CCBAU 51753 TaxID=1325100 RepID=UPI001889E231|nr:hypothetical protein [Bradyrhizobium sp. CCBAU 51753]QOZ25325.1 hypothetical protein XH93_18290 [Bradyrhizobium sp. CCBAU 51753]
MTGDLFGHSPDQRQLEVHEHAIISVPRANHGQSIRHSHEGGSEPHQHPDTGPASYTIDKDEWLKATGLRGGGRKQFTKTPEGEQLPIVELEEWQKSFEVHVGALPPGFRGTGGGMAAATRMILAHRMTVSNVVPFPSTPKRRA